MVSLASEFWRGRRVLITGHSGFKGSWLSRWLRRLGAEILGLSLPPLTEPSLHHLLQNNPYERWQDIRDLQGLRARMIEYGPEIVFHLAAQALVRPSYDDPVGTYETNVMGTVNVLEAVRATPSVLATVIVTSDKCYENNGLDRPYRESDPKGGSDPYSSSKGCAELVVNAYRSSFFSAKGSCRIASGRAGNVIGGGDWAPDRLIPDMVRAFASGVPARIRNPASVRPWQHVLDPLSGYIRLAEMLASEEGARYASGWNFAPPVEDCCPVSHLADHFVKFWGHGASWTGGGSIGQPETGILRIDASMARTDLGWRSVLGLDEALSWTVRWYEAVLRGEDAERLTSSQIERYEQLTAGVTS